MRVFLCTGCTWLLAVVFWFVFGACVDAPFPEAPPASRVLATWDPRACGDAPYRVAVELEDASGVVVSGSTPCVRGSLALELPHFGIYFGRIYAWWLEEPQIRSLVPFELTVDEPVVRWIVQTPQ